MMTKTAFRSAITAVLMSMLALTASARVISYAPYTSEPAFPGVQHRMNRYFLLVEGKHFGWGGPVLGAPVPYNSFPNGKLVLYDSTGAQEPKVIFPKSGDDVMFSVVAARERVIVLVDPGPYPIISTILIQTNADFEGKNPQRKFITLLSTDSGSTWRPVALPGNAVYQMPGNAVDVGGPYVKGRNSPVRIGTEATPFIVYVEGQGVFAIDANASARKLVDVANATYSLSWLLGSNRIGSSFIVRTAPDQISIVDVDGSSRVLGSIKADTNRVEGWITPGGDVYLELTDNTGIVKLKMVSRTNNVFEIAPTSGTFRNPMYANQPAFFSIPTFDYDGAWMIERGPTLPTTLSRHTPATGLQTQWSDITGPEVEALHAGSTNNSLLIQVHRERPQPDQRLFIDPALAIWRTGQPAPREYDELFMNEQFSKGFVHLDVEAAAQGAPFVFDSGAVVSGGGGVIISPAPPSSGGGDVIQEWGVVRASLKQQLVLPGIGRTPGAYGSDWVSDVILQNSLNTPQNVTLRFVPNGTDLQASANTGVTVTLQPREIRLIPDVVKTIFGLENANGALLLNPESAVNANSRTYTRSSKGSYGFNMNAIDIFTAVGSRFPLSFAGAFPGSNFRTNIILTDVSGHSAEAKLLAAGTSGIMGLDNVAFTTPRNGQVQANSIGSTLNLVSSDTGALLLQPVRGSLLAAVFAIDNRTNDPTYFPPDLTSSVVRTIPAVGHVDGANNSKFRSDVYLFNPSNQVRRVTLSVKAWDTNEQPQNLQLTLLPREAKVIRDFLFTAFGKTGFARLRYVADGGADGVRVTSRTYTIEENGGTYGFLMPPLNNFQGAASGDSLEILGAVNDPKFRTNIGLVELNAFPTGTAANVRIEILDNQQRTLDSFTVTVPSAGGMQLNDVFRARNITTPDGTPVLIRVSPTSGMVGAYASMVDNGTNDPTYLAANLAAQQ